MKELEQHHNIEVIDKRQNKEYNPLLAEIIGQAIVRINEIFSQNTSNVVNVFGQQYIFKKGLKEFKQDGVKATTKEVKQLHTRNCFTPVHIKGLTPEERKKAQHALLFLSEKTDGSIKARLVFNGKPTRDWLSREDTTSQTASQEGIFMTATVDAKEERDVMSNDIPNAFIQAEVPKDKKKSKQIIIKITGKLVNVLISIAPETYGGYVV